MTWRAGFSTLGCAGRPLTEVVDLALQGRWEGLELRSAPGEPVQVGLTSSERADVRRILEDAGLTALAIASYVEVDDARSTDSDCVAGALAHVELACEVGASFVRVFPGGPSGDGASVRRLRAIARELEDYPGVAIGLETHDTCARGEDVARVLSAVDHPQIRVVWDVQHPWLAGETIADTRRALLPFVGYVQINDLRSRDDPTPRIMGTGALPLRLVYDELRAAGYDGWVSLEWPSYWYPAAPPLGEALVAARRWLSGAF